MLGILTDYFLEKAKIGFYKLVKSKVEETLKQVKRYISSVILAIREYIFPSKYCKNFMTHIVCGTNMTYVEEMIKIGGELIQNPVFTENNEENYKKCLGFLWFICSKLHQDDVFIRGAIQFSDEPSITKIMEQMYQMGYTRTSSHLKGYKLKEAGFDEEKDYNLSWPFKNKKTLLIIQRKDKKFYIKFEEHSTSTPSELLAHTRDYVVSMFSSDPKTGGLDNRKEKDVRKNEFTYGIAVGDEVEFCFDYEYIFSNLDDSDLKTIVDKWNSSKKNVEAGSRSIEEKLNRNDRNTKTFLSDNDFQTIKELCENDLDLTDKLLIPGYDEFKNYNPTIQELIRKGLKNEKMNLEEWALLKEHNIKNYALSQKIKSLMPVHLEGVNSPLVLLERDSDIIKVNNLIARGEVFVKKAYEQLTISEEDIRAFIWFIFSRMSDDDVFEDGMIKVTPDFRFKVILDKLIENGIKPTLNTKHYNDKKIKESSYDIDGLPFGKKNVLFIKLNDGTYGIKIDNHSRTAAAQLVRGAASIRDTAFYYALGIVKETKEKNLPERKEHKSSGAFEFNTKYEYIFENFEEKDFNQIKTSLEQNGNLYLAKKIDKNRKVEKFITEDEFKQIVEVCIKLEIDDAKLYVPDLKDFSEQKDLLKKAFLGVEALTDYEVTNLRASKHLYINYCKAARNTFLYEQKQDEITPEALNDLDKIYSPYKIDEKIKELKKEIEEKRKLNEGPAVIGWFGV